MTAPMIHHSLCRDDLLQLVAAISLVDASAASPAAKALENGNIDDLLDSPEALEAVLGRGGPPAAVPLTLLWYVPIRASLLQRDISDIDIADYTATLPVFFCSSKSGRRIARGERSLTAWANAIEAMPPASVGRAERAAECGSLALWWAGCFPEAIVKKGGRGMIRAYLSFASNALEIAGSYVERLTPDTTRFYQRVSMYIKELCSTLEEVRRNYLTKDANTSEGRINRFLDRLAHEGDSWEKAA